MTRVFTLKIDDIDVTGRENETIIEVAYEHGIKIPKLCALEGLTPVGACRMCLVEVAGTNKLLPACTTRVTEGMAVTTSSERLRKYRRMTVELLFAEGNHVCSVCVVNGHCELQNLAIAQGVDHIRMPYLYPKRTVDASHERFALDPNRCVLCTRCIRVCGEVEGAHTWDLMSRGIESAVITDLHTPWGESDTCTACGKCVQVCPTGALFEKGTAVGEMTKRASFLATLTASREDGR